MTLVIWETSRSLWLLPSPHTQMGRSLDLHQRGGPLPEHTADTRLRRSFLAKSPYVTMSSCLFVQPSFATTVHSLQNLNIKARDLPSFFGPHWRRTWRFVKFVLPEVFQASLWAFSLVRFLLQVPHYKLSSGNKRNPPSPTNISGVNRGFYAQPSGTQSPCIF